MQKTLGGDRLGAGKKQKVTLHGFERSTHDLGYLWRSTMGVGTLVPFLCKPVLPGDTFDINLDCDIKTHPTVGPLFGSMKVQLDIFTADVRLYQGQLHNNKLGIGMNMANIKLPQIRLYADVNTTPTGTFPLAGMQDLDNTQINPSSILAYLGIRGVGIIDAAETALQSRDFNAVPLLAYWDIYKNYYANKQEEIGAYVYTAPTAIVKTVTSIKQGANTIGVDPVNITGNTDIIVAYSGAQPIESQIIFQTSKGEFSLEIIGALKSTGAGTRTYTWKFAITGVVNVTGWRYLRDSEGYTNVPKVNTFSLNNIDDMRESILAQTKLQVPFIVNDYDQVNSPYSAILDWNGKISPYKYSQQGLGLKTYQSDLFNNWLSTAWLDGTGGINDITKINTAGGSFTIDTLNLSKKVYDMLNRIAISGGSYDDWLDANWMNDRYTRPETPVYHGGLSKELVFQEVISNSETPSGTNTPQPLGTLAGRGVMASKHKGGRIHIKVNEPGYVIGIVSITPRVDYSQGNNWDTHLSTMDDFHKPALDEIGFQELITEQMAWWSTYRTLGAGGKWTTRSAGKQPAWINYMTSVNEIRGNFAIPDNEMFMVLSRRYELLNTSQIKDLTTYIDPVKFNHIFADTSLDAQNYWTQVSVDITARRKMSAKQIPNL